MTALSRWMGGIPAACLALAAVLLATSTVLAVEAGPDNPRKHYWLRNAGARVVEAGPMDARLREIADAFGRGDLKQARILAEDLLAGTQDGDLRAEAAAFLIQSHLGEGDFQSARAAAERINDAESLARINRIEAEYKAEVGRLQRIVATTKDPAEAARAQFLTARAHERAGRLDLAEQSYWKVIRRYSERPEGASAVAQVVRLHRGRGEPGAAVAACEEMIVLAADSAAGAAACRGIPAACEDYEGARSRLRRIATEYRGTQAGYMAAAEMGRLHAAEGMLKAAELEWSALLTASPDAQLAETVRRELAGVRYRLAKSSGSAGDLTSAARYMALAVDHLGPPLREDALESLGHWHRELGNYAEARRYYGEWGNATSEPALGLWARYHAAVCLEQGGQPEEAIAQYRQLLVENDLPENLFEQCHQHLTGLLAEGPSKHLGYEQSLDEPLR